jgi:hypothetical protein
MIDVGDMRKFAKTFGKWLYGVNPDLKAEKLEAMIRRFATSAPIGVGEENSPLSLEEFIAEAARSYAPAEETLES